MIKKSSEKKGNKLDRLFNFLEKDRTNVITVFLLVLLYAFIRATIEIFLFAEKNDFTGSYFLSSTHNWAHVLAFFTSVFLLGTLIISLLANVKIRKAVNVILFGFWLIIIAPILDFFVFGVRSIEAYYYAPITEIPSNISTYFLYYSTTWGLRILGIIIMALATFYVAYRSKSIIRTILTPLALLGVMALFGSLNIHPVIGDMFVPPKEVLDPITGEVTKPFVGHQLFMFEVLFVVSVFLVVIYVDRSNKKILPYLLKNIKPQFFLYPMVIMGLGLFSAGQLDITNPIDFTIMALILLIAVFGWLFACVLNLYYEPEIPKKKRRRKKRVHYEVLTKSQLKHSAVVLAIVTLGLSLLSGFIPLLLCTACILCMWMYFLVTHKFKNIIARVILFGICTFLGFLIGYFSLTHFKRFPFSKYEIWYPVTRNVMDMNAVIVGMAVLIVGIILLPLYLRLSGPRR